MKKLSISICLILIALSAVLFRPINAKAAGSDFSAIFDADYYLTRYPDIAAASGGNKDVARVHFLNAGMREGRQGCASFDVRYYKAANPDLQAIFGENLESYYLHYMTFGKNEGRAGSSGDGSYPVLTASSNQIQVSVPSDGTGLLAGRTVILDPGHGGTDPGCIRNGVFEKNINYPVALKVKALLEANGATVIMTRSDDSFVSLESRWTLANAHPEAIFVSIHVNAISGYPGISGMNAYCDSRNNPYSNALRLSLLNGATASTGARNRGGDPNATIKIVHYSYIPAALIEIGFLSSTQEFPLLITDDYQNKVAAGITAGITDFYNNY